MDSARLIWVWEVLMYMIMTQEVGKPHKDLVSGIEKMKTVENFKYFSSILLEENGRNNTETNEGALLLRGVGNLAWRGDVHQKSRKVVYKVYYLSLLTYAVET